MRTAYKFRIYPNKQQSATLDLTLETCRRLWNIALEDRKVNWELNGIFRSYEDQAAILTSEKKIYLSFVLSIPRFFRKPSNGSRKLLTTFSEESRPMRKKRAIPGSSLRAATTQSRIPNLVSSSMDHD
jgi:transposase